MLFGVIAFAQSRVVTGKITNSEGNPISFATVTIKGTPTGLSADANGSFSTRVNSNSAVLVITATGYKDVEVPIGSQTVLTVLLEKSVGDLQEVVVTSAFGIKRAARGQASNVQNVNSDQLNTIRQQNVNDALAGKVAGVQVQSQSAAKLGVNNIVRLRGENGFGVGAGALYVVDGTIVSSSNDINTDDVEDVTVLQGPAAAALFGPQGSNGAIVINTKKGKKKPGIGLEINSNVIFDNVYITPNVQNSYAGGTYQGSGNEVPAMRQYNYRPGIDPTGWAALNGKYYIDDIEDESWGPKMVGQEYIPWYSWLAGHERSFTTAKLTPQPHNVKDYFNTGVTRVNNINFTKAGSDYSVRVSYTNTDIKGLIPTSFLKKNAFNTNVSFDLSSRFTIAANINFISQKSNAENDDTYGNQSSGSFNQWFHRDIDMNIVKDLRNYRNQYGQQASWNHATPDSYDPANPQKFYAAYYWYNPYAWQDANLYDNGRKKLYGDASITYKANNDLSFKLTYRRDQLATDYTVKQLAVLEATNAGRNSSGFNLWETVSGRAGTWQGFSFGNVDRVTQNIEFLGTYRKKLSKSFTLGANVGADLQKYTYVQNDWNSLGGLSVADEFIVSNSKKVNPPSRTLQNSKRNALFARADIGFRNYAFIEGSYRRDYSSTEANEYFIDTKAAGVSLIVSDLLKIKSPIFNYFKIRGSIGQIVNTLAIYQNTSAYTAAYPIPYNGNVRIITEPDRIADPSLRGASNVEKELGVEMRFLKNRVGFNVTYWDRTNKDFPTDVSIYGGSGYTTASTNVGEIKKQGVDVQVSLVPVRSRNIDWTINATWGYLLKNTIVSLAPGITRTTAISNGQAGTNAYVVNEVGKQWGQLIGRAILRDPAGNPIVDGNGLFVADPELKSFGSVLPKYTGGVQNSFNFFKNFTLNVNIDYSVGGSFFSLSKYYGYATGLYAETAVLNDKGVPVRDKVSDGGGVHVIGVDNTPAHKAVDMYIPAGDYFRQFAYGSGIVEPVINSLTFVKLRELSLGYKLPISRLPNLARYIQTAEFSIVSRNPFLLYAKAKGFDPSEISTNYGEDGQLPGTRSMGVNLKLGF